MITALPDENRTRVTHLRLPFHLHASGRGNQTRVLECEEWRDVPQKIHFNDFWSRTFCRVGGSVSSAIGPRALSSVM